MDLFFLLAALIFFFTVLAAVDLTLLVGKEEYLIESLLDRGDTARVFAGDDIHELLRKIQLLLCDDRSVLDDIDRDAVVYEAKHVQIQLVDRALDLDDVLFPHLVAVCIFDDRHAAVHLVELQIFVDRHTFSGLDMIEHDTFI